MRLLVRLVPQRKKFNREIGGELMELTRAVVKKDTFVPEKGYKFHLAQPSHLIKVSRPMEPKHCAQAEVKTKWLSSLDRQIKANMPLEVFLCFKTTLLTGRLVAC